MGPVCLSGEDVLETDVVDLNQQVVCLCVLDSATALTVFSELPGNDDAE